MVETFPVKGLDEIKVTERDPLDKVKREPKGGKQAYSIEAMERMKEIERLTAPEAVAGPAETTNWTWPHGGTIVTPFKAGSHNGIGIAGKRGDWIAAVADGRVLYAGSGFRGYGKQIIVRHSPDYLSVYSHLSEVLVTEGQIVKRGKKIAELGARDAEAATLYFEVHFQGKPVDPQEYLP